MARGEPLLLVLLLALVLLEEGAWAQFQIPNVDFQALTPKGFRVSIPDVPGIKLFGFHGKINAEIGSKKSGDLNGDVITPKNGRWIFEDMNVRLKVGDVINYWIFVQQDAFGYRKDGQSYTVGQLVAPNTPWPKPTRPTPPPIPVKKPDGCENPSITTINDGKPTCQGQIIFQENFKETSLNRTKWTIEQKLPTDDQEHEFVSYQGRCVTVSSGKLKIIPLLQQRIYPFNNETMISGTLDLTKGCTASIDSLCKLEAQGYDIIPPVVSGKISTRNNFSFKYGKIEIRAKLPLGDWIYPQIFLDPSRQRYGTAGYESGQIRIAYARGNRDLLSGEEQLGNSQLSSGIMLGTLGDCRTAEMKTTYNTEALWGDDYHTYTIVWKPDLIEMFVDDISFGQVLPGFQNHHKSNICPSLETTSQRWTSGSKMAPYDQEFHITLGLGVGGIADFPDGPDKFWRNKSRKAKYDFYTYAPTWYEILDDNKALMVDTIKVTAL